MTMRNLIFPLAVVLMVSTANGQPNEKMMNREGLNLTDDQIEKLDQLRLKHQIEMVKKQAEVKEARLELKAMMRKTSVDEKAVLDKQNKISALKAQIAEAKLRHQLAVRKVFNEEQLKKWLKMRHKGRAFGRGGHGFKHDDRGPGSSRGSGSGCGMGYGAGRGPNCN